MNTCSEFRACTEYPIPIYRCLLIGVCWLCLLLCMGTYTWGLAILRLTYLLMHNQPTPTSGHLQIGIGHSGHALNSEHVLRGF